MITGHIHCRKDHFTEGIHSIRRHRPPLAKGLIAGRTEISPSAFKYTVTGAELTKEFIPLEELSGNTASYGQDGHVMPEDRDYSLAWEK